MKRYFFSIVIVSFYTIMCIEYEQPNFVNEWNNAVCPNTQTIFYSSDKNKSVVNENDLVNVTLFFNGLVSVECAKRFALIRSKLEYQNQYPGSYLISNGPVNNKEAARYAFIRWLGTISSLKQIVRVSGALPYAFNYEEEAKHTIKLLRYLHEKKLSNNYQMTDQKGVFCKIGCLQAICYGFHGIVCGLHAAYSSDQKAKKVREDLQITDEEAKNIFAPVSLIIAQAPMIRLTDPVLSITKRSVFYLLCIMQLSLLGLAIWLDCKYKKADTWTCSLWYGLPLLMTILQCSTIAKEKLAFFITFFLMKYVMPSIVPHIADYKADLANLLEELDCSKNLPNLTLLVTHQKNDEFVGQLEQKDKLLLQKKFSNVIFVESNKGSHLYESEEQKAVQQIMRKEKKLPYNENAQSLLEIGGKWLATHNELNNIVSNQFTIF